MIRCKYYFLWGEVLIQQQCEIILYNFPDGSSQIIIILQQRKLTSFT
jgi:hypothetical protein